MTTWQPEFNFQHTTSLVDELNRHWSDGGPSDQLSAAGVLVHILDGKGIDHISGFANTTDGLPPPPQFLWDSFGRPNRALPYGDRMSASLLSRHTPNVYSPFNIRVLRQANFSYLPGVILDASIARPRLSCCYPFDPVSVSVRCAQFGGDATCTPGCAFAESAPSYTKRLTRAHRPADLATCMLGSQALHSQREADAGARRAGIRAKLYNELVFDVATDWSAERDSGAVIAFFLERPASEAALGLARSLRDLQPRLPLLRYDRHATETPFSVLVADDS